MSLQPGERIGDYEVLGPLGTGGMGEVYKVRNTISNRVEAAKVLLPNLAENPELAQRFIREIRVHASLDHPNIAQLRTALRVGNQLLMIMELVDGQTLKQMIEEKPVPLPDGLRYVDQVLAALAYAHQRGVIHRDIKPANMMLAGDGTVKLLDFGIAKAAADQNLTRTGFTVGSLFYMSPEQIQATAVDARSDLYSLGVSLYEIVTGKLPFEGDSEFSVMSAHLEKEPVPPLQLDPNLPQVLNDIIMMAIEKDPAKRFQSAPAMRNALQSVARALGTPAAAPEAESAPPETRTTAPSAHPRRGVRLKYLAIGAVVTIAVLAIALTQIPKWRTTTATHREPSATESVAAETPPTPVPVESTAPSAEPNTAITAPPAQPATAKTNSVSSPPKPAPGTPRTSVQESVRKPAPRTSASAPPKPVPTPLAAPPEARPVPAATSTTATPVAAAPATANPAAAPATAAPAAADEKLLDELHERMVLMATRIGAVNSGLDNLEREQARSGLSLRGDIVSARRRMEYRMDQAEAAINDRQPDQARKSLDQAERDLELLERFLNI